MCVYFYREIIVIITSECAKMRSAAGPRPEPLNKLTALPRTPHLERERQRVEGKGWDGMELKKRGGERRRKGKMGRVTGGTMNPSVR